jgi:succinyl-CoA synthetase beta subunit
MATMDIIKLAGASRPTFDGVGLAGGSRRFRILSSDLSVKGLHHVFGGILRVDRSPRASPR